jgi:hypothetical protein
VIKISSLIKSKKLTHHRRIGAGVASFVALAAGPVGWIALGLTVSSLSVKGGNWAINFNAN